MLTLRLLGAVEIAGPPDTDLTAIGRQPKRLALLGYLCLAGRDGWCRRDALLPLFWPGLDAARARPALRQALHYLRQHLGPDVIRARGEEELGVDATRLACDAVRVDEALRDERWADAVAAYGGDLFAGRPVAETDTELAQWIERERQRLRAGVLHAVESLRREADARDDREDAARWARRATQLAPADEAAARRLIRRLVGLGDHGGALAEAARVTAALRADGATPSDRLDALVTQVRAHVANETPLPVRVPRRDPPHRDDAPLAPRPPIVEPPSAPVLARDTGAMRAVHAEPEPHLPAPARPSRAALAALALLAIVLAAAVWRGGAPGAGDADHVTASSAPAIALYREGVTQLRGGDRRTAHRLFDAALRTDSTFAMAALMAARTAGPDDDAGARTRVQVALRLAPRATRRERLTIRATAFRLTGDPALRAAAESLARAWPADPEARTLHVEALAHGGRHADALREARRALAAPLDTAATAGCARCGLERAVLEQLFALDSIAALEREARRLVDAGGGDDAPREYLELALRTQGRCDAADSVRRQRATPAPARLLAAPAALAACRGDHALAARLLDDALRHAPRDAAAELAWLRVIAARAAGQPVQALAAARRTCDEGVHGDGCRTAVLVATGTTMRDAGRPAEAAAAYRALAAWRPPEHAGRPAEVPRQLAWHLAHEADALVAAGDFAGAMSLADSIEATGGRSDDGRDAALHHFVRGRVLAARGDTAGAVTAYRRAHTSPRRGCVRVNLELGRLLAATGQAREAVAVLRAGINPGLAEATALYATVPELRLALADALERAGDRAGAAAELRQVLLAWREAEPAMQGRRDAAAARLTALERGPAR